MRAVLGVLLRQSGADRGSDCLFGQKKVAHGLQGGSGTHIIGYPNRFAMPITRRKKKAVIHKSPGANGAPVAATTKTVARKIGLKPGSGWHRRNFLTEVLLPTLFTRRAGKHAEARFERLGPRQLCITWIGHASFLIRGAGANILIDPNWARWLKGIKRLRHPGLHLHDLPDIDLVLITHAHFDHLDRRTLRQVASNQPIVVPFEVGNLVHDLGFKRVHELHYWESWKRGPIEVILTPAQHWGARFLHDAHRGFGGYLVRFGKRTLFHCGDTAWFDGFRAIGARTPIDIALLPIGAYDPPSRREVHMNPEQAVRAFLHLGAKTLVPMHYGTFRLSYEPVDEPLRRLLACARDHGIEDRVRVLTEGESVVF